MPSAADTDLAWVVRWVRLIQAHYRLLIAWTLFVGLATLGSQVRDGLGRVWEARARVGVESRVDLGTALPILKARITSGDLARALQLPAVVSVNAQGTVVLDVVVRAPSPTVAIQGANTIVEALLVEQTVARQILTRDDQATQVARTASLTARQALLAREASVLRQRGAEVDQAFQAATQAADVAATAAARATGGVLIGFTPEERRADRLERERHRLAQALAAVEREQAGLLAPPSHEASLSVGPPLRLIPIDRAVGATRLPTRIWAGLLAAVVSAALLGVIALVVRQWWREVTADEGT